jgi:hypothetical protein
MKSLIKEETTKAVLLDSQQRKIMEMKIETLK